MFFCLHNLEDNKKENPRCDGFSDDVSTMPSLDRSPGGIRLDPWFPLQPFTSIFRFVICLDSNPVTTIAMLLASIPAHSSISCLMSWIICSVTALMLVPNLDHFAFVVGDHDASAESKNRLSDDLSYDFLSDDDASQFGVQSV
jgi:hypothetical protein